MTGGAERRRHLDRTVVTESGERVCECCGIVVDMQAAASDMVSPSDYARTAPVLGNHTLGHTSPEYDRIHHMLPPGADSRTRNINAAMRPLRDICARHGYGNAIHAESVHMLRWAYATDLMGNRNREAMSLACIYIAHHAHDTPVPLRAFLMRHTGSGLSSGCRGIKTPIMTRKVCACIRRLKAHMVDRGAYRPLHHAGVTATATKILWELEGTYGRRTILSAMRSLGRTSVILDGRRPQTLAAATLCAHLEEERARGTDKGRVRPPYTRGSVAAACGAAGGVMCPVMRALGQAGFRPDVGP